MKKLLVLLCLFAVACVGGCGIADAHDGFRGRSRLRIELRERGSFGRSAFRLSVRERGFGFRSRAAVVIEDDFDHCDRAAVRLRVRF